MVVCVPGLIRIQVVNVYAAFFTVRVRDLSKALYLGPVGFTLVLQVMYDLLVGQFVLVSRLAESGNDCLYAWGKPFNKYSHLSDLVECVSTSTCGVVGSFAVRDFILSRLLNNILYIIDCCAGGR